MRPAFRLLVEGVQTLLDGNLGIGGMDLVGVDRIGPEPLQARRQGLADIFGTGAGADLGAEGDLVAAAPRLHPAADDVLRGVHLHGDLAPVFDPVLLDPVLLGVAPAVGFGRVQEGDALLNGVVQHLPRGLLVNLPPESGATQSDRTHHESRLAQRSQLHADSPLDDDCESGGPGGVRKSPGSPRADSQAYQFPDVVVLILP